LIARLENSMSDDFVNETAQSAGSDPFLHDQLTGLFNHTYLQEQLVTEFSRATRYHYPISCLAIDLDHFKLVNEEKSFRAGDAIIQECAQLLSSLSRTGDLVGRYGGEEFMVILPHVDYQGAFDMARRVRLAFSEHIFHSGSEDFNLTISVGISCFPEDAIKTRMDLITFARQSLFRSKAHGRNRITLYKQIVPTLGQDMPDLKISEEKVVEFQRRLSDISEAARRSYIEASRALIFALESKDATTAGHAASCAKYARQLTEAMGLSVEDSEVIEHAALLHDIGKICIGDEILLKPAKLTFEEYEKMKQHPYLGYKILQPIKFLYEEAILVLHHHEWFSGEGYPSRMRGEEIPLGSRVIAVIDSYDTMRIAGSRYKKTTPVVDAVNELINYAGSQFDPKIVKAFIEVLKSRHELLTEDYHKDILEQRVRDRISGRENA